MKLYSVVTSERASKSQGGNRYIDINLSVGSTSDSKHFANVLLNIVNGVYTLWVDGKIVKEKRDEKEVVRRLEYLRRELRAKRISYGELSELQGLAEYIPSGDVELLEASGVPEFSEEKGEKCPSCNGSGNIDEGAGFTLDCKVCDGTGWTKEEKGERQKGEECYTDPRKAHKTFTVGDDWHD